MASFSFVPSLPSSPDAFLPPADAASAGASRVPLVTGVAVFCLLLVTTVTALRLYTRRCLLGTVGLDDYLAVVAWLTVVTVGILYLVHTQYGLGNHIWEPLTFEDLMISLKLVFAEGLMYNASLMAIKVALFAQYYRLIAETPHRVPCLVLATLVMAWCLGMVLIVVFGCLPVQAAWDFTITDKDCSAASHGIIIGIGNIVTDFIIILLPVPIVWKLEMQTGRKLAITGMCVPELYQPPPNMRERRLMFPVFASLTYLFILGIFTIGLFACMISILRLTSLRITDDFSYSAAIIDCWTIGELTAACCCPSLMVLQPLIRKLGVNLGSVRRGSSNKRSEAPSQTRASSRKIASRASNWRTASRPGMPENMDGSEVELIGLDPATKKYDNQHDSGSAV